MTLTPSEDAQTALVACTRCPWRVVATLPSIGRVATPVAASTAVMVDAHAFEALRLGAQVEAIFTQWAEQ